MKTLKLDLVSFLTLSALSAAAATHYVVPPGTPGVNPSGEFTSWATAATNIQAAVSIATNNSLVLVASGHYRMTNQIVIASAITLRRLSGASTSRCPLAGSRASTCAPSMASTALRMLFAQPPHFTLARSNCRLIGLLQRGPPV